MDGEAEGEVGVDAGVLHLLHAQPARVPPARPDPPRLRRHPVPPEVLLRHALHRRVPHAGQRPQLHRARHLQPVVFLQLAAVGPHAVADEHDALVGQEPPEHGGDGGDGARELEQQAPVPRAQLQRARPDRGAAERRRPLHPHADGGHAVGAEAGAEAPPRGVHPPARRSRVRGHRGDHLAAADAHHVLVGRAGGAAEASGQGGAHDDASPACRAGRRQLSKLKSHTGLDPKFQEIYRFHETSI